MMFPKEKRKRAKGTAVGKLNDKIHQRDGDTCIIPGCGRYVLPGEKIHHEPGGKDKQDREECTCLLCQQCHRERHFDKDLSSLRREQCRAYLRKLYPEFWSKRLVV